MPTPFPEVPLHFHRLAELQELWQNRKKWDASFLPSTTLTLSALSSCPFCFLHPWPSSHFYPFLSSYLALLPVWDLIGLSRSHCICNSFLYPSYWVSFEPVSQGFCQIWTLHFWNFFSSFLYSQWIQRDWQTLRKGNCQRHALPTYCLKTASVSHIHNIKDVILLSWNG